MIDSMVSRDGVLITEVDSLCAYVATADGFGYGPDAVAYVPPSAHEVEALFPALNGGVVTERHARICREQGHATHSVDGVDTGSCPRCGDLTRQCLNCAGSGVRQWPQSRQTNPRNPREREALSAQVTTCGACKGSGVVSHG